MANIDQKAVLSELLPLLDFVYYKNLLKVISTNKNELF